MSDNKLWEEFEKKRDEYRAKNYKTLAELVYPKNLWTDLVGEIGSYFQRKTRGFSDDEIWDLQGTLTQFILPRVKFFAQWQAQHGMRIPEVYKDNPVIWLEVLNRITLAFEIIESGHKRSVVETQQVQEGLELFARFYEDLKD